MSRHNETKSSSFLTFHGAVKYGKAIGQKRENILQNLRNDLGVDSMEHSQREPRGSRMPQSCMARILDCK